MAVTIWYDIIHVIYNAIYSYIFLIKCWFSITYAKYLNIKIINKYMQQ